MEEQKKQPENEPVTGRKIADDQIPDNVEEVATAADIEAFMRDRRKARMEK